MIRYKDLINSIEEGKLERPLTWEEFGETIGADIKGEWKRDSNWSQVDEDIKNVVIAIPTNYIEEGVEVVVTLEVNKDDYITSIKDISEY